MAEQTPVDRQRRLVDEMEKRLRSLAHGLDAGQLVQHWIGSEAGLDQALPE